MMTDNLFKQEPMSSEELTPNVSSSAIPMDSSTRIDDRRSSLMSNAMSNASTSSHCHWVPKTESEQFAFYVAQRLDKLPDERKRRKLENAIQEAIVNIEKESLE